MQGRAETLGREENGARVAVAADAEGAFDTTQRLHWNVEPRLAARVEQ